MIAIEGYEMQQNGNESMCMSRGPNDRDLNFRIQQECYGGTKSLKVIQFQEI